MTTMLVSSVVSGSILLRGVAWGYSYYRCRRLVEEIPRSDRSFDAWLMAVGPVEALDDIEELAGNTAGGLIAPDALIQIAPFTDGGLSRALGIGLLDTLAVRPKALFVALERADEQGRSAALRQLEFTYEDTGGALRHPGLGSTVHSAEQQLERETGPTSRRCWHCLARRLPGY